MEFATRTIHAGQPSEPETGALIAPIFQTSTYEQEAPGVNHGFDYSRTNNPTRARLEAVLADLEGVRHCAVYGSGLAAENAVLQAYLKPGDEIVIPLDVYGGTYRILNKVYQSIGCVIRQIDLAAPGALDAALSPRTKLVWIESPTNPRLLVYDIAAIASATHAAGALLVVDNTFASPYFQQPFSLGADIVVHSVTKYLAGHSDVIQGAVLAKDAAVFEPIKFLQNATGAVPSPFDCWLTLRGLKTLELRMQRHAENAEAIARALHGHPLVSRVYYPGLAHHPGHEIAARQMTGFGGMVSFELNGTVDEVVSFVSSRRFFALGESLGGVKALVCHPARMTHASIPAEERATLGLSDTLVRLSTGCEHPRDLVADLLEGLAAVEQRRTLDVSVGVWRMSSPGHPPSSPWLPPSGGSIDVGILGATGIVGQHFVSMLADHPWFRVTWLAASERSAGKAYRELPWRLAVPMPDDAASLRVHAVERAMAVPDGDVPALLFSALDASIAGDAEIAFAKSGRLVVSNARNHRMDPLVPLLIPEVNPDHVTLLDAQRAARGWTGGIVTNPNCSTVVVAMVLGALRPFQPRRVMVTTLQALSGAGYPGVASLDAVGNVIPYIGGGEEEKIETETLKLLGRLEGDGVVAADFAVSAQTTRVPVPDGHTAMMSIDLAAEPPIDAVVQALESFTAEPQSRGLPTAPGRPIVLHLEQDRPQPRLDVAFGGGMPVHCGRIRRCPVLGYKLVAMGHNVVRGAAGAAILNAELLASRGMGLAFSSPREARVCEGAERIGTEPGLPRR